MLSSNNIDVISQLLSRLQVADDGDQLQNNSSGLHSISGSPSPFPPMYNDDVDLLYRYRNHETYGIGMDEIVDTSLSGKNAVKLESLKLLFGTNWLDDEVVNYFLVDALPWLEDMMLQLNPSRKWSFFYSTFFVQTLFDEKNSDKTERGRHTYSNINRWADQAKMNPFEFDFIFCPYNYNNEHWGLGVIVVQK